MFKAVLFDLDGTLIRTMETYLKCWQKACHDFGFEISAADYYPLEGMKAEELAKTLCRAYKADEQNAKKMVEQKTAYFLEEFSQKQAEIYPGVEELLSSLKNKNILSALVTASTKDQVSASVPNKILEKFNFIVTGEISGRGKPYPDPYLAAANALGVDPAFCVGVENAPLGVQSVKSAGMYCVGVASTVAPEVLRRADEVVFSVEKLSVTRAFQRLFDESQFFQ